ncbi:MAG TPA: DNA cytosine methyltransferase [Thermoplasmata archaeon]|nr:DNA cytosine methyltransferase [Thermoplasmata archaeon]
MKGLTSVDLFSGAGGLTEGFRQAGYEVLASLDNWGPAADTHARNFPKTEMFHADILEFDPSELPRVDVLIGSPPCTEFSYANKGGHGNLTDGMRFVLRFLRFVHDLNPRYWAMENVPRLLQSLPQRVHLRKLGLGEDGFIEIPVRRILNSADYGAPQKRLRLFSGKFLVPEATHYGPGALDLRDGGLPWMTARDVLDTLPDPLAKEHPAEVTDPNYGFKIPLEELSDHFMDTVLTPEEVQINRKSKVDHSWYGRMRFPDPIDRPARTVMATQTGVSRETLVLEWLENGQRIYRRPTIRESACFQTFPITYQFWGRTAETRYKLVGNAVPPVLARAVARAIARKAGAEIPRSPSFVKHALEIPEPVVIARRRDGFHARRFPVDRKFRDHLPGSRMGGFRIDVDNLGFEGGGAVPRAATQPGTVPTHIRTWTTRLYLGSGKRTLALVPSFEQAIDQLAAVATTVDIRARAERLTVDLEGRIAPFAADGTTLQAIWAGKVRNKGKGPQALLWKLSELVDRHFPPERFEGQTGPISPTFPRTGRTEMPVRTAAFLLAARFATEVVERKAPGSSGGLRALEGFVEESGTTLTAHSTRTTPPAALKQLSSAFSAHAAARLSRQSALESA